MSDVASDIRLCALRAGVSREQGKDDERKRLLSRASGRVLEVAAGTWRNAEAYDPTKVQSLVLTDASAAMCEQARAKAAGSAMPVRVEAVGVDAIPIVAMLTFLIGVVFAYLLGLQAQRYGATIFVVDGIGLAVCREMSPLLTAVLVAGRSGAAFTAEIGSMKVQEEVDAIRTLGLSPVQVLVVPRLVAIVIALPLLVFVGDLAGLLGGQLIGATQLDISSQAFLNRLHATLTTKAVVVGLVKAPVFAACIAMIACRMGLLVSRDARSVGQNTTSTVVQSICWVIVIDAVCRSASGCGQVMVLPFTARRLVAGGCGGAKGSVTVMLAWPGSRITKLWS